MFYFYFFTFLAFNLPQISFFIVSRFLPSSRW